MSDSTVHNLLKGTGVTVDNDGYGVVAYQLAEPMVVGMTYTMLVEGTTPAAWAPAEGEGLAGGGCVRER